MDLTDVPRYTTTDVGRLVGLRPDRVRRWLRGYEYSYLPSGNSDSVMVRQGPIIKRKGSRESIYASFLDLIDLLFVKEFLEHDLSLQKIRKALTEAESIIGHRHFAHETFFTNGNDIYLKIKDQDAEALLQLLSGGQWVIADIILQLADQIEFNKNTGVASRWYPGGKKGFIVLDPNICYGAPSVKGYGILTNNIFDLFMAEEENIKNTASWLEIDPFRIKAAVEFEKSIAAAA